MVCFVTLFRWRIYLRPTVSLHHIPQVVKSQKTQTTDWKPWKGNNVSSSFVLPAAFCVGCNWFKPCVSASEWAPECRGRDLLLKFGMEECRCVASKSDWSTAVINNRKKVADHNNNNMKRRRRNTEEGLRLESIPGTGHNHFDLWWKWLHLCLVAHRAIPVT